MNYMILGKFTELLFMRIPDLRSFIYNLLLFEFTTVKVDRAFSSKIAMYFEVSLTICCLILKIMKHWIVWPASYVLCWCTIKFNYVRCLTHDLLVILTELKPCCVCAAMHAIKLSYLHDTIHDFMFHVKFSYLSRQHWRLCSTLHFQQLTNFGRKKVRKRHEKYFSKCSLSQ